MKQPFFIVGLGRSGTTYLFHLLNAHPRIALTDGAKVLDALCYSYRFCTLPADEFNATGELRGVVDPDCIPTFSVIFIRHARQMLEEFYAARFKKPFTHWGDKLPDLHCAVAARSIFPHIRFLVPVRDPRDVLCSAREYAPRFDARSYQLLRNSTLAEQCESWCTAYQYLFEHLDDYHIVRYERLVAEPAAVIEQALHYLGLTTHRAVIDAIRTNRTFAAHGTSPSAKASIGRWKRDLSPDDAQTVEKICGSLMRKLGYNDLTSA